MLLAPLVTAHYEMGFVVGLKGFVGAAMGGLVNYPLSVAGVFIVGVLESFASFLSSSYRDARWCSSDGDSHPALAQQPRRRRPGRTLKTLLRPCR